MDIFFKECIKSNTACVLTLEGLAKTLRIKDVHAAGRKNVELNIAAKQKHAIDQQSEDMAAGSTLIVQPDNLGKRAPADAIISDSLTKKKCLASKSSELVLVEVISDDTSMQEVKCKKSKKNIDSSQDDSVAEFKSSKKFKKAELAKEQEAIELAKIAANAKIAKRAKHAKKEEDAKLAKQEGDAKIAKQEEDDKLAKQEEDAKLAKQEEDDKLAKQEEDAKVA